jgi:hypothetical protein
MVKRLRMPRTGSGVLVASTMISRILSLPPSTPRNNSRTPRSCRPCSISKLASTASARSTGACSSRERSSSRGSRLGYSRGIGLAMVLPPCIWFVLNLRESGARDAIVRSLPLSFHLDALLGRWVPEAMVYARQRTLANFRAAREDEQKSLCTRACVSPSPCGCSSAGLRHFRPNSWACRVLCPALDL